MRKLRKKEETMRIKVKFLFFPKTLPDKFLVNSETRWLEKAAIEQVKIFGRWWLDCRWID